MSHIETDTNTSQPFPACRLYAILARESPIGVIFRRGPSKRVQLIHWNTDTDTFTPGQWFHGRIYEHRGDLSPDGTKLIYFAQKINPHTIESDYSYAWTAISKPPYLTALALWPKGSCWGGGGLFLSDTEVWLNHDTDTIVPHPDHQPKNLTITHEGGGSGEDDPIQLYRMARDGWRHTQEWQMELTSKGYVTRTPRLHRKQNPLGWQKLTMATTLTDFAHHYEYSVRYAEDQDLELTGAEWADWDQKGRLVFAKSGKIFVLPADAIGREPPQELIDLNRNVPEAIEAPDWAKRW